MLTKLTTKGLFLALACGLLSIPAVSQAQDYKRGATLTLNYGKLKFSPKGAHQVKLATNYKWPSRYAADLPSNGIGYTKNAQTGQLSLYATRFGGWMPQVAKLSNGYKKANFQGLRYNYNRNYIQKNGITEVGVLKAPGAGADQFTYKLGVGKVGPKGRGRQLWIIQEGGFGGLKGVAPLHVRQR